MARVCRYGFQGQERDDEVKGQGNHYTAEFWNYDSRLGRRWEMDPIVKHHESPYAVLANNPIWLVDINGADTSFSDSKTREAVLKYVVPEMKKNGKKPKRRQKYYTPEYAEAFERLVESEDMFLFKGKHIKEGELLSGELYYNGEDDVIVVQIALSGVPANNGWGTGGVLFEETYHATQFLDGKLHFEHNGDNQHWNAPSVDIYDEIEAKQFALGAPGVRYAYPLDGVQAPTEAGLVFKYGYSNKDKLIQFMTIGGTVKGTKYTPNGVQPVTITINPAYSGALIKVVNSGVIEEKTKTSTIFGYPINK